jgi:hypothetical protein
MNVICWRKAYNLCTGQGVGYQLSPGLGMGQGHEYLGSGSWGQRQFQEKYS